MNTVTARPVVLMLTKLALLVLCATLGGASVIVGLACYYAVMVSQPLSTLPWRSHGDGIVISVLAAGAGTGVLGLGYLHVLLAYALVLRKLPAFWAALPRYFFALLAGTLLTSIVVMELAGAESPLPLTLLFGPPVGFWGTVVYLWWKNKKRKP